MKIGFLGFFCLGALICAGAHAEKAAEPESGGESYTELKRRIDILGSEIQKLKIGEAATAADRNQYGLGPGASKVYRTANRGVSLGGYGEILYENFNDKDHNGNPSNAIDRIDLLRAILYTGYKFDESWVFNSELEVEHATTEGKGAVSVEFAYLDYLWKPELNFRAGSLLIPMGFFNELHEPTVFLGTHRPDLEDRIIPTTWSEGGAGIFGEFGPLTYRSYAVAGLNASKFTASGIREGRQGASQSNIESGASVTRLDYTGAPGLLAGVSVFIGNSSTERDPAKGGGITIPTKIFESHLEYRWRALELRFMAAYALISNVAALNAARNLVGEQSVGSEQGGYFLQAGYEVFRFTPFARWEQLNTQLKVPDGYVRAGSSFVRSFTLGFSFKPIEQIVLKADHQFYLLGDSSGVNQWNVSAGYVF